jgi:hypothetical protein
MNKDYSVGAVPPVVTTNKNPLITTDAFRFVFSRAPNTAYFAQNFTLPTVVNGETRISRPTVDAFVPGPKTEYDALNITMLLAENMENYIEIFNWVVAGDNTDDMTVFLINSKSNPHIKVTFKNAFPMSIGSVNFNAQDADTNYGTVDISFRYDYFTIET